MKDQKRYSMGFKLKVMEELREGKWKTVAEAGEAYGVTPTAIRYWMNRMGFEYLKGRIIYVKTASEVDEIKRLKAELRKAKEMLADEIISHKIDEVTLRLACEELKTTPEILKKNGFYSHLSGNGEMGLGLRDRVSRLRGRSSRSIPRRCGSPLPSV